MEHWDIYDENRNKTGRTVQRGSGEMLKKGEYHMVVHICLFNSEGKMLVQQRQPFKDDWRNMWDVTVGGSAVTGDTSLSAALRETREEIGLSLAPADFRRAATIYDEHVMDDYYIVNKELSVSSLKLQTEEVKAVKWADCGEIEEMIEKGEFIPYHRDFINLLFYMSSHTGTRTAEDKSKM